LRRVVEAAEAADTASYPDVLLFYQGGVEEGTAFFRRLWPEARAVSDVARTYYTAFGLERGGWKQMLGPRVLACGVRAAAKGNFIGVPVGDPLMMPGLFLVEAEKVVWQHDFAHAGDHPDFAAIPRLAAVRPE
jgi:hypothetical protein